ncbi:MAG: homoserine kinase, partial [Oscillospiraceae bacterium]|nr:homoserine kinase [Oscillospiraceae bacterium]
CIVGGVFGANEILGRPFTKDELLDIAAEIEGHPDNVSPALLGGFTANAMDGKNVRYVKAEVPENLVFAAFVPPFELKTADARAVMPKEVSLKDSVFNLSRSALITASFLSGKYENLKLGCEDKLHQPFRLPLIPGGEKIIEKSYENGAIAAYISGAGSTMMAIFDCGNEKAEEISKEILSSADFNGWKYFILNADNSGAVAL